MLFWLPQKSLRKEKKLQAENNQIFHHLQTSLTYASILNLGIINYLPEH